MPIKFGFKLKSGAFQPPNVSDDVSDIVPGEHPQITTRSFILPVGGNFALAGLFLYALLDPLNNVGFIVQAGLWLFIVEFLSIFVSVAVNRSSRFKFATAVSSTIGFITVALFAFAFGWFALGNIFLPLIFLGSVLVKIFRRREKTNPPPSVMYAIPLILGSLLPVLLIGSEFWVNLFPFPAEFNEYAPSDWVEKRERGDISGEFIDRPQTMLVWGIIYFGAAAIINLLYFRKMRKTIPSPNNT